MAEIMNPLLKQRAERSIVFLGPALSTHFPKIAADAPKKKIAIVKTHPISVSFQSSGACSATPIILVSGSLNTLNA